jgi:hypothetical protein
MIQEGHGMPRPDRSHCAWAAHKTLTSFGQPFQWLEVRLGKKKAIVVVTDKILVIIYYLLLEGTFDDEERYDRLTPK